MTNVEVIQELYRCFREKDDEGFRCICADDVKWIQNVGFPHGAVHSGVDAVIEGVFRGNRREWEGFAYRIEEILDAVASVVVIGRYEGHHHITKKPMQAAAAHVYDLRDGKVCRFRMFADTKPMWDAMM
ncbi:MAG: nuclear transport factor 2 family protein [Nitrospirales bacterium]|nr:nuclear transport factor 2 family protein [Nitrospirales bacterium]